MSQQLVIYSCNVSNSVFMKDCLYEFRNRRLPRWCIQEDEENHKERAAKRVAKRADKGSSPSKKKNVRGGGKFPSVRVSDSLRRKIVVLNVVGLLCDIRPLHDR
jgi:hypothetical protein